ncbi:CLUMA_CG010240, isoform A [Clunio marinus]|uniref:CLUMA_CG010240, isoform A n=1 Tax=Clunio marinus TaxID=568069 RepID=A0A1J1I991_9DIPT|nr:CLUMA_CG010240, isoform A [Clunio marinus]
MQKAHENASNSYHEFLNILITYAYKNISLLTTEALKIYGLMIKKGNWFFFYSLPLLALALALNLVDSIMAFYSCTK